MTPWWVPVLTFFVGGTFGLFTFALLAASSDDRIYTEAELQEAINASR